MKKCPVCGKRYYKQGSIKCPACGYDESCDFEKYLSLGKIPASAKPMKEQMRDHLKKQLDTETKENKVSQDVKNNNDRRGPKILLTVAVCFILLIIVIVGLRQKTNGRLAAMQTGRQGQSVSQNGNENSTTEDHSQTENQELSGAQAEYETSVTEKGISVLGRFYFNDTVFGNSELDRSDIRTITFLDSTGNRPSDYWDVSGDRDGTILAWVEETDGSFEGYENSEIGAARIQRSGYHLYIASDYIISLPADSSQLFRAYVNVESIQLAIVETSSVEDMSWMFSRCESLNTLDLSSFETENVESMEYMFWCCSSLSTLELSNFDTAKVTDMS